MNDLIERLIAAGLTEEQAYKAIYIIRDFAKEKFPIFGGAIVTEQVFKVNGIGAALIGAIHASDLPMVQTLTFIFAVLSVLFNLIADVLYGLLDPRIRYD